MTRHFRCSRPVSPFGTIKKLKRHISLTFQIPQLVKPLPFSIPESGKKYPFRAEPPCIGHCTEKSPSSITIFTCKAGGSAGGTSIDSMRTDCFGIPSCSRVLWMSFPQENANSTLNKTNSHDAFMFMTNFLEKLLVSTIIGQALYTTTNLWFLVLYLKILHSFEALFSYH